MYFPSYNILDSHSLVQVLQFKKIHINLLVSVLFKSC